MVPDDAGTSPAGEGRRSSFPFGDGPGRSTAGVAPAGPSREASDAASGAPPGRIPSILGSVAAGVVAAVFGTLLHGQLLYVGSAAIPIGALGALVLAASLFLLSGLWARTVIQTAVAGAVAYGVVALISTSPKTLILTGASESAPGTALAGNLWLFGVLVVTLGAVVVGSIVLRPVGSARRRT
ncbi:MULTISPECIES: hypothetical protein [unclassified Arthrobacter]|uniref:hypothetical protein n=1 Tax=Arthrobacter sp. N1 TaxID=619291 RepID=UPI003BAF8DB9